MTRRLCILIALCAFASSTQPQEVELQRFGEVGLSCNAYQFRCRDGQCIASDAVCDGAVDCRDGSDESRLECTRAASCGPRAFRCNYGACVDGDAVCNGIRDCADNSDETLPTCHSSGGGGGSGSTGSGPQLVHCNQNQFRCENGLQCIDSTSTCDGSIDCLDKSDETVSLCGSFNCPQRVFRCQYGACIDMDKKCDGVVHCADGSDESVGLCGEQSGSSRPHKDPYNTNSPRPTAKPGSQRPTPPPPPPPTAAPTADSCPFPEQPDNGRWLLESSQCPGNADCRPQPGVSHLEPGTQLVYSCNKGYALNATAYVFCARTAKWSAIPSCQQIRCEPLNSAAVDAQCRYEDNRVSCDNSVLPDTTAQLSCRNSYTQDVSDLTRRDSVRCNAKGQWEPKPIKCVSVCGIASTGDGTPLIVNGSRASVSEFPWHGTLYKQKGNNKQFICGATIIKDDLLVTAAHCVYDEVKKKADSSSSYYVAVGNIFRDYDYEGHDARTVRKGRVKQIIIDCKYYGLEGNYASDIAILKLEKAFTFSSIVMPICLDTSPLGDQLVLEAGNYGKVAGFGRTSKGESSFILQSLTVPYIPLNTCKSSSIASNSERYITIDKFCAGYQNGSSVCDGDSGGGLVFKTDSKWYLRGIVSVGIGATKLGATRTCDSYAYSLYTRVSSHMEWIQDVILRLEKNRPAVTCS